jgi:hypothetical protein
MRPDPIYWVIYLALFTVVAVWGWDFLPRTRRPKKRKSSSSRKPATPRRP